MKLDIIKIHLFLLMSIMLFNNIHAQESRLDSLERVYQTDIHDTIKLEVLYDLAIGFKSKDDSKSIFYINELINHCNKTGNDLYKGVAYNMLGMIYLDNNYSLDTVMFELENGMRQAKIVDNARLKGIISNGMAITYDKFGQKDKALALYQQAFSIFNESGIKGAAIRTLGNLATIVKNDGDLELAKKYYFQAIDIAREIGDDVLASQLGNNLAGIYFNKNQLDSALILYEKAVEVNKAGNDEYFTSLSLSNIGKVYNAKKKFEIAETYLKEGFEVGAKINDTYCMANALNHLSDNYFYQKEYAKAISAANKGLEILGENGEMAIKIELFQCLGNSYEAQGNFELALANQKLYHTFSDSIYNIEKSKQINDLKIKYEVAQKETENQLLKSEKETAQRTIRNRGYIGIGLILALIFAIGWGTSYYRANKLKKTHNEELTNLVAQKTADLKAANNSLLKMNENLEQANYELRTFNFIASHDIKEPIRNIGNYAGLVFKKLPNDLKLSLGEYFKTISSSTSQLYTLIEDFARYTTLSKEESIEKSEVDLNELVNSIENLLTETIEKQNGKIINNGLPIIKTNSSLLYTSLKNLIENGLKFNESTNPIVEISYNITSTHHEIRVQDNGIGVDEAFQDKIFEMFKRLHNRGEYEGSGIGLAIVKLCTEKLNGNIEIKSKENGGSEFILSLPL